MTGPKMLEKDRLTFLGAFIDFDLPLCQRFAAFAGVW